MSNVTYLFATNGTRLAAWRMRLVRYLNGQRWPDARDPDAAIELEWRRRVARNERRRAAR